MIEVEMFDLEEEQYPNALHSSLIFILLYLISNVLASYDSKTNLLIHDNALVQALLTSG